MRKFLYKNSYAPKAACICELLLGFFEKCAKRSAQYQKLYFEVDFGCNRYPYSMPVDAVLLTYN